MIPRRASLMLSLAAVALLLAACGGSAGSENPKIDVTTTEFQFTPNTWTAAAGSTVAVNLTNNGTEEHEWVVLKAGTSVTPPFDDDDEDKVFWEVEAEPGQTTSSSFTAPSEPGTYTVVCGVAGHLEAGMQGTLTVK